MRRTWLAASAMAASTFLFWPGSPDLLSAQQAECVGGWARSCAAVDVGVAGDQLLFYVPNAVRPSKAASLAAAKAPPKIDGVDVDPAKAQKVRVYRSLPGAVCDPATGRGCEEVTGEWLGPDPGEEDEEEEERCVEERREDGPSATSAQSGEMAEADDDREADCAAGLLRNPREVGAVVFAVAVPPTAYLWLKLGGDPVVVRSATDDGDENDDGNGGDNGNGSGGNGGNGGDDGNGSDGNGGSGGDDGNGSGGNGGDGGDDGNGSGGNGGSGGDDGNGSGGNGGDGGDDGNGSGGNGGDGGDNGNGSNGNGSGGSGGDGGDDSGGNGGNDGNGGDNGNGFDDDESWPSGPPGDNPRMTEVPEPVTTTLVGLGLLGYAGARMRRRLRGEELEDGDGIG